MSRKHILALGVAVCAVQALWGPGFLTYARWGFFPVGSRPIGTPLGAAGLSVSRDGDALSLLVRAQAIYLEAEQQHAPMRATLRRYDASAVLETAQGEAVPLPCRWRRVATGEQECETTLPADLPDGAHTLQLTISPPGMEAVEVTAALPILTPAHAHLLTDRPQYAPGEVVKARALTFSRRDLTPLPERDGIWSLSIDGEELLSVPATSDAWGVVTAEFPLPGVPTEDATLSWCSGDACDHQAITVADIVLPWLQIEASPTASWIGPGQPVTITGQVTTADGRPAPAALTPSLSILGDWPMPTDWEVGPLTTDAQGRFSLSLPELPADLTAPVTLKVGLLAEDGSGGSHSAAVAVPLSPDPIVVSAATELGGGMAEGISNRVYLRLTRPDGTPVADREATITSRWDSLDPGRTATTDADGVLAIQLDPGPTTAIVLPPPPVRHRATERIALSSGVELLGRSGLSLEDRAAFAAILPALTAQCVGLISDPDTVSVGLSVRGGRIVTASPRSADLSAAPRHCISSMLQGRPWPTDGLWRLSLALTPDPLRPTLTASLETADTLPPGLEAVAQGAVRLGSRCVADAVESDPAYAALTWQLAEGSRRPVFSRAAPCLADALSAIRLSEPAEVSAQGLLRLGVAVPAPESITRPSASVLQGWELVVDVAGETGRWLAAPAEAPALRLRPETPIASAGDVVAFSAIRGRSFRGALPGLLTLTGPEWSQTCGTGEEADADCPPQVSGRWRFSPPDDGVYWVRHDEAAAAVLVRPASAAGLVLSADQTTARPGEPVTLTAQTDGPAVVSLVGHDARLAALMSLPQPDDLRAASLGASGGVFGRYDAVDLVTGQLSEAAALAVLSQLTATAGAGRSTRRDSLSRYVEPEPGAELERSIAQVALVARRALSDLPKRPITYEDYATVWDAAAADLEATDPWGLPLSLERIAVTHHIDDIDPRDLISDAAAMPEDLEPWSQWARGREP